MFTAQPTDRQITDNSTQLVIYIATYNRTFSVFTT